MTYVILDNGNQNEREYHEDERKQYEKRGKAQVLRVDYSSIKNKKMIGSLITERDIEYFRPLNERLPRMIVKSKHVSLSDDLKHLGVREENVYFQASFLEWDIDLVYPYASINKVFGKKGDVEVECEALLNEHEVYCEDFGKECLEQLQEQFGDRIDEDGEYVITEEDIRGRRDLRGEIVCTIDPKTARDLDDALSIKLVRQGVYEIGVHIADVSHFVRESTEVDREARLRTTSVYLPYMVYPMLPRMLCETFCSLNPGVDRLSFSCFFEMDEDGNVFDETATFSKSIIRSCSKMSYDQVQKMISGEYKSVADLPEEYQPIGLKDKQQFFENIILLSSLGMKHRENRQRKGFLKVERKKMNFELDKDTHMPLSYKIEERYDSMKVVEEYMLLANRLVAAKLVKTCKELAVLRKHNPPREKKQDHLNEILRKQELSVNFENIHSLSKSIEDILSNNSLQKSYREIVSYSLIKILEAAEYFVVQDTPEQEWLHFALNFPVYTHFTSPIRRYPDILVHRLLEKALIYDKNMKDHVVKDDLLEIMDKCNECKAMSRKVNFGCDKIFVCLYLKSHAVRVKGIVSHMSTDSFTIVIPEYAIEKDMKFDGFADLKMIEKGFDIVTFSYDKRQSNRRSQGRDNQSESSTQAKNLLTFFLYQYLDIELSSTQDFPIDYQINLLYQNRND